MNLSDRPRRHVPADHFGNVPLHLAERLVEAGLLEQQEAEEPRALGTALVNASEHLLQKK